MWQELLQNLLGAVRHTNRTKLAFLHASLHLLPSLPYGPIADDIASTVGEGRKLRVVAFRVEAHRPVH